MVDERCIHLYVEKYCKDFLFLDFVSNEEFLCVRQYLANNSFLCVNDPVETDGIQAFAPSGMLFEHVHIECELRPKEGNTYEVKMDDFVQVFRSSNELHSDYDENVPAGIWYLSRKEIDLSHFFVNEVSTEQFAYIVKNTWNGVPCGAARLGKNIKLVVKSVGQGSWNQIWCEEDCNVVFDCGCSIFFTEVERAKLLRCNSFMSCTSLIISHWDIDHYNLLTTVSDGEISKLCCAFVPQKCFTRTSKKVAKRLEDNCKYLNAVPDETTKSRGRKISLKVKYSGLSYALFVAEESKNKNLSGLALAVWTSTSCVLFGADHSYAQVFVDMKNEVDTLLRQQDDIFSPAYKCHLVVPHHGGHAGKVNAGYSCANPGCAIVSTGKNNYGHPFICVEKALCAMGFSWIRTDKTIGDSVIKL